MSFWSIWCEYKYLYYDFKWPKLKWNEWKVRFEQIMAWIDYLKYLCYDFKWPKFNTFEKIFENWFDYSVKGNFSNIFIKVETKIEQTSKLCFCPILT